MGLLFCISYVPDFSKYISIIYLSAGAITILSTNSSCSYFQISPQTRFILTHGISKLYTRVFETLVRLSLCISQALAVMV